MKITIIWLERFLSLMESAEDLEAKIKTMDGLKDSSFKENPSGPTGDVKTLDDIVIQKIKLEKDLRHKIKKIRHDLIILESYLDTVNSLEIRMIIRQRYIYRKRWNEVGEMIGTSGKKAREILEKYFRQKT